MNYKFVYNNLNNQPEPSKFYRNCYFSVNTNNYISILVGIDSIPYRYIKFRNYDLKDYVRFFKLYEKYSSRYMSISEMWGYIISKVAYNKKLIPEYY